MVAISKVTELDVTIFHSLLTESVAEGYKFVARLCDEWISGDNRFAGPGEALFVAQNLTGLVGVCGLNRDPYVDDPSIGRVRHLYVLPAFRRQGVGRALVRGVMDAASLHFRSLRLRTTPAADSFYRALGFQRVTSADESTYVRDLESVQP